MDIMRSLICLNLRLWNVDLLDYGLIKIEIMSGLW